jgi:hypothetical protein
MYLQRVLTLSRQVDDCEPLPPGEQHPGQRVLRRDRAAVGRGVGYVHERAARALGRAG